MAERGEQGVPGEQGVRGGQGIQGVPGATTQTTGEKGEQGEPGKSAHVVLDKRIEVSFWVMLLIFVATSTFMGWEFNKVRNLAESNRELLIQAEQATVDRNRLRAQIVRGLREADYRLCIGQERLKQQNREQAIRNFNQLDETLTLLGLERTPAIVERAERDRDHALIRNAPRPNGCRSN